MNELIKPLAKVLDISASELERIVSSLNVNAPQIYERLLIEYKWWKVLDIISSTSAVVAFVAMLIFGILTLFICVEGTKWVDDALKIVCKWSGIIFVASGLVTIICVSLSVILAPHIDLIMQLK
ncbi:hypothetical protein Javan425_0029 [Streptococcus phage Javan425]|uniref:Phage membrane protein n=1 Tax=Streptococcus porcinus str. Jelinkova 176 TaxID=873448 RepID=A0ABP2L1S8_STRPO|nr:hypothetical protein [Streptococcus porcinus]EGJ28189.1 hypothetical protein STRPO_0276 [Streptococcus porcinus str. Jelinkova 176]QBX18377.1 hypothetical protein Javan423_0031 [Streptococcus phage Javan423]QBX18434.1 hypothetical protein Javan425_0029 [Streptococcus phage Javan425]SQG43974.1 Uncharacterised protein [Streptococcus porcinus]